MRKTLLGLAVLAMTLLPSVASAQTQSNENGTNVENVRTKDGKANKGKKDKKERGDKKGDARKGDRKLAKKGELKDAKCCEKKCDKGMTARKGGKGRQVYNDSVNLASLNLNESQKAKIQALDEARRVSAQEMRQQARQARMNNDTTVVFDGSEVEMIQSKYLKDLREVLTADQYVQFLENNYVKAPKAHKAHAGMKAKKVRGESVRNIKPAKQAVTASK